MIRIASALIASAFALLAVSCGCCTSDEKAPELRPLPQFKEIQPSQVQPSPEVNYTK